MSGEDVTGAIGISHLYSVLYYTNTAIVFHVLFYVFIGQRFLGQGKRFYRCPFFPLFLACSRSLGTLLFVTLVLIIQRTHSRLSDTAISVSNSTGHTWFRILGSLFPVPLFPTRPRRCPVAPFAPAPRRSGQPRPPRSSSRPRLCSERQCGRASLPPRPAQRPLALRSSSGPSLVQRQRRASSSRQRNRRKWRENTLRRLVVTQRRLAGPRVTICIANCRR